MTDPSALIQHAGYQAIVVIATAAIAIGLAMWVVEFITKTGKDKP